MQNANTSEVGYLLKKSFGANLPSELLLSRNFLPQMISIFEPRLKGMNNWGGTID